MSNLLVRILHGNFIHPDSFSFGKHFKLQAEKDQNINKSKLQNENLDFLC